MKTSSITSSRVGRVFFIPLLKSRFALLLGVFLTLQGARRGQVVSDVLSFTGANGSENPIFVVTAQGRDGKWYGTTSGIRSSNGTVFNLQTNGGGGGLNAFDGPNGALPAAGVVLATDGSYYGTTFSGGSPNLGVLFQITSNGAYTVLHEFAGGTDGSNPDAAPIEASDGNLYGTTTGNSLSASTVYKY